MQVKCRHCGQLIWPRNAIKVWDRKAPDVVFYVHRPDDLTSPCFRAVVGDTWTHGIGAAQ